MFPKGKSTTTLFTKTSRTYNNMFSFTSIGGKIDSFMNNGCGPLQFILSGQNYQRIGSLLPVVGSNPKIILVREGTADGDQRCSGPVIPQQLGLCQSLRRSLRVSGLCTLG